MPYSAGTVFLQVVPSFDNVQRNISQATKGMGRQLGQEVDRGLRDGTKDIDKTGDQAAQKFSGAFATTLQKRLKESMAKVGKIDLEVNDDPIRRDLARIRLEIEKFSDLEIDVDINGAQAIALAKTYQRELEAIFNDQDVDINVRVDAAEGRRALMAFTEDMERSLLGLTARELAQRKNFNVERIRDAKRAEATITADLKAELQKRTTALQAAKAAERTALAQVGRTGSEGDAAIARAAIDDRAKAEQAAHRQASEVRIREAARGAVGEIAASRMAKQRAIEDDNARAHSAQILAVQRAAYARVAAAQEMAAARAARRAQDNSLKAQLAQATGQAANSFRIFSGALLAVVTLGPLLIPVLAGITAGLGGIAVMALAAGLGIGALVFGLGGIGNAVSALSGVDKERRKQSTGSSSTIDTSSLRDARTALARTYEDSGRQINAALRAQESAERQLTRAVEDAAQAQRDLQRARRDAADDLEDINNRLTSSLLDEQRAAFALQEAGFRFNNVLEDPQASDREKSIAEIEYKQAVQQFKELQTQNRRLEKDVAERNAAGVDGSEQVVAAQKTVITSTQSVADAQRDLNDASLGVAEARVEEARQIRDAELRVADAMASVAAQSAAAGVAGSAAMDALRESMDSLSPAGQRFASFLYGLKPLLDGIRDAAQEGLLPGLQDGIQSLVDTYGPAFTDFIGGLAKLMGDLFRIAGKALTAPFWKTFFETMAGIAPQLLTDLLKIGGLIVTIIAGILQAFAPLAGPLSTFIVGLFQTVADWATGLGGSAGFQSFLEYVEKVGPKVFELIGLIVETLLKLAIGLAPYADKLLDLAIGFFGYLAGLDPETLAIMAGAFIAIVGALQSLAGLIAVVSSVAGLFVGITAAIGTIGAAGGIGAIAAAVAPILGIIIIVAIAIAAIIGLIFWIKHLWETNEEFRDRVTTVIGVVIDAWNYLYDIIAGFVNGIVGIFRDVLFPILVSWYENIIKPVIDLIVGIFQILWDVISTIFNMVYQIITFIIAPLFAWFYDNVIRPWWEEKVQPILTAFGNFFKDTIVPAIQSAIDVIGAIWSKLIDIFKAPITFLVETVLNRGIIDNFNKLVDIFPGMTKVDHVSLPSGWGAATGGGGGGRGALAFAGGGVLPGYTPGRDVHRFYSPTAGVLDLSGGEGIARPEIVRAIGKKRWDEMNSRARGGDVLGGLRSLGGFADGGILGFFGGAASSIGDAISNVVGSVSQLLSDPGGILRAVVNTLVGTPQTAFGQLVSAVPMAVIDGISSLIETATAGAEKGPIPSGGGIGIQAMSNIIHSVFPGVSITSGFRPGAITAVGTQSYHGLGRAIDLSPSMELFNWLSANYPDSRELFYSPAGPGRQILNGRVGARLAPVTVRDHYDHVHWAYQKGGVMPKLYDNGGYIPPGLSMVANKTGKPEPVLTDGQWDAIRKNASGGGNTYQFGDVGPGGERFTREIVDAVETKQRDSLAMEGIF